MPHTLVFLHRSIVLKIYLLFNNYPWTRKLILWKDKLGYLNPLVLELVSGELKDYINVILMSESKFVYFLEQDTSFIQWQNAKIRAAICNDTWTNFISHGTGASHWDLNLYQSALPSIHVWMIKEEFVILYTEFK